MRSNIARLPVVVVVRVFHQVVPECDVVFDVLVIRVWEWTHIEEETVPIRSAVHETCRPLSRRFWSGLTKRREEVERVWQKESAVMMKVVSNQPVSNRGLGRSSL